MKKKAISAPDMLNEAYEYEHPAAFSRGLKLEVITPATLIYISGTASVDEKGNSLHLDDFNAQTVRTLQNISALLQSAGATWQNVVKTTVFLKDIKRDYRAFNEIRSQFFQEQGLFPYPASVCVQSELCREELLVEIEAQAIITRL